MPASLPRVMVDLFCGRGGWTKGFQAHGWHCIGIDLYPQPDYPGEFIQADIAHLYELPKADFYCCSSPCEQFSVHGMPEGFLAGRSPQQRLWPWLGIALFEHSRRLLDATGKPYVMENVRCAKAFVGPSDFKFGPFYLWGNSFSRMWPFPPELSRLTKGSMLWKNNMTSRKRKQIVAEIPLPLASHIAQTAGAM